MACASRKVTELSCGNKIAEMFSIGGLVIPDSGPFWNVPRQTFQPLTI